jgi:hypothetical protein
MFHVKHRWTYVARHPSILLYKVPGLRHYCHRCDRILWGWQVCPHKPFWWVG